VLLYCCGDNSGRPKRFATTCVDWMTETMDDVRMQNAFDACFTTLAETYELSEDMLTELSFQLQNIL
jgi:hypothetical protein